MSKCITRKEIIRSMRPAMDTSSPRSVVAEYEAFINSIPPEGTPAWDKFLEELYDCSNIMDPSPSGSISESDTTRETEKDYIASQIASSLACNRYSYGPHSIDTQDIVLKAMQLMDLVIQQDRVVKSLEDELKQIKEKTRIKL